MSWSTHHRDALDANLPLAHRQSHARSCAMLLGQKYRVPRSAIIDYVHAACGAGRTYLMPEAIVSLQECGPTPDAG